MKASKTYTSSYEAKVAFSKIFGVGPYSSNGTYCEVFSVTGSLDGNTITLKSTFFVESSLQKILDSGDLKAK